MANTTLAAVVALLLTCGAIGVGGNLIQLATMIKQMTGKNAIPNYMAYGCYCGWGGRGMPKDQTDWCCRNHDCCYKRVDEQGCCSKLATYSYIYKSGNIICGNEPWYWERISDVSTRCERLTCECDQKFVQCLKKNLKTYQKKYSYFPNFLCIGHPPLCPVEPRMRRSRETVGRRESLSTEDEDLMGINGVAGLHCCLAHDCCYEKLSDCNANTDVYDYSIDDGVITCGEGSSCEKQVCECDKTAALCLRDHLDTYDKEYRFYSDTNCQEGPMKC
ncbi:otoconin-90-like [Lacerta agilis]|uniref:otoconin-90-like n=1 Tax=Lacerta agilis TaxID=80427 RepID=UPI0014197323|nr:otoconin-90-like [Lacerta agilis]